MVFKQEEKIMDKILEALKWFTTLDGKGILKVVLVVIFAGLGYYIYNQEKNIKELNVRLDTLSNRYNTDTRLLQKNVEDCNKERFNDAEEISKYWRDKYESLYEKSERNYKNIKEIKNNE